MLTNKRLITPCVALILTIASVANSNAEDTVTLRFADWMPESTFTTSYGAKVFMKKAKELSQGRISFQYYPAEQLGKGSESLTLLQSGVADIANVAPAYVSERLPLSGVIELPGAVTDSCVAAERFYDITQPGSVLYEAEYKNNGVRLIFVANLGPYRILTNHKSITSASDLSGLKMRTAGGSMAMTANQLGANPIRMQGSDVLPSLSRGTLDGVFWGLISVEDWSLETALDQMIPNLSVGSFNVTYSISDRTWDKLSSEMQDILVEAGKYASKNHCEYVNSAEAQSIKDLQSKHGIKPLYLADSDVKNIREELKKVNVDWAAPLNNRGLPADQVIEEFFGTQ